ncbi:hypothetical protein LC609_32645 [Nostoc sp. XA013]|jgi:leucyl-tRNA synthetase|uniref:Uncharacterized protein n=1 Tax=Nostoc flagelliforme CCNUN1 TaxID=2038116 RepID=A0A2K8T2X2_9NOSO|nr:hypothetical protein [Nostoc flagelliforme]AUB42052.1 hypothetical protein COO91_08151 [Nostoc flagelliforme CCNUN1]MCC5654451.1 hypothetical protein [Nostoc sp. XA013]
MNNGSREKQIAVRVTDEEKNAFEDKAKQEGKTPSQVLLQFVHNYIGRSSEVDVQQKLSQLEAQIREIQHQLGKQLA